MIINLTNKPCFMSCIFLTSRACWASRFSTASLFFGIYKRKNVNLCRFLRNFIQLRYIRWLPKILFLFFRSDPQFYGFYGFMFFSKRLDFLNFSLALTRSKFLLVVASVSNKPKKEKLYIKRVERVKNAGNWQSCSRV